MVELWLRWLREDTRRHAVFVRLESSWRQTDALRNLRPVGGKVDLEVLDTFPGVRAPAPPQPPPIAGPPQPSWWRRVWQTRTTTGRQGTYRELVALAAAAVAGMATLGGWLIVMAPDRATHRTERGGFERVVLPDGSTALLNTNTEIRMRFTRQRREIVLTHGEALFTVARDERRPFEVFVGDDTIRAIGTSFDVRLREPRGVEVMVAQGTVAIDRAPGSTPTGGARSLLAAGDDALLDARGATQTARIGESDIERRLAWTRGQIWLSQTTLADAIAEFNRYNSRQLVLGDPTLATLRVGGSFTATDPAAFLAALERIFGIQARARAQQLILTAPAATH
jgi:transmembrane sensor